MWKNRIRAGNPEKLGVTRNGKEINFAAAIEHEKECILYLYRKGSKESEAEIVLTEEMRYGDVCAVCIEGLPIQEYEYLYRAGGKWLTDPYADQICGRECWGRAAEPETLRCRAHLRTFSWGGDRRPELGEEACILYKTHVRGFTMDPSSGVKHPGTFTGIKEKIPYLKKLGITQLELMPVYEFAELCEEETAKKHMPVRKGMGERLNYWGYGSACFFAPKASYAATEDPVTELKQLVKALHSNGIELILEFYFPEQTRPGLVSDCIRHWIKEYHIDGVHVNSHPVFTTIIRKDPLLARTKIYSEYFPEEGREAQEAGTGMRHLGEYHDDFMLKLRRFLKGDEGAVSELMDSMHRNPAHAVPVHYAAGHNGFTLMDLVSYETKHNEANGEENRDGSDYNCSCNYGTEGTTVSRKLKKLRERQMRNALLLVLLSQGIPALYGGDEMENSQQGNNNVYCQDNPLSWIQWNKAKSSRSLQRFVQEAIAFRKSHPAFLKTHAYTMHDMGAKGMPDLSYHGRRAWYGDFEGGSRHVGILYAGCHTKDETLYVLCNMHTTPQELALPTLPSGEVWRMVADTGREDGWFFPEGCPVEGAERKMVQVEPRTIVVLAGKKYEAD